MASPDPRVVSLRPATTRVGLEDAWRLACRFGELVRLLPVAAAIVERAWLTGNRSAHREFLSLLTDAPPRWSGPVVISRCGCTAG